MPEPPDSPPDEPLPEDVERRIAELPHRSVAERAQIVRDLRQRFPRHQREIEALLALLDLSTGPVDSGRGRRRNQ